MTQFLLIPSIIYHLIRNKKTRDTKSTQTIPIPANISTQTVNCKIPVQIKNKKLKPNCFIKNKERTHGDWLLRKLYLKNKILIFNRTNYEITAYITPRNVLNKVGIKGINGDFNNEYEEEFYIIKPNDILKIRNYPTFYYYMKLFIKGCRVSKKLYSCNDDIIISNS